MNITLSDFFHEKKPFSWNIIPDSIFKFYVYKMVKKTDKIKCIYLDRRQRYEDKILLNYIDKIKSEYTKTNYYPHNLDITIITDGSHHISYLSNLICRNIKGFVKKTKNMLKFDDVDINFISINQIKYQPYLVFSKMYSDVIISMCCEYDDILFEFFHVSDIDIVMITKNINTWNQMIDCGFIAENSNVWETNYKNDLRIEKLNRIINK